MLGDVDASSDSKCFKHVVTKCSVGPTWLNLVLQFLLYSGFAVGEMCAACSACGSMYWYK